MDKNFNTYIDNIDFNAFHEFCVNKGKLRHFAKGEEFVSIGKVGRYIGFIQSGTLKYVARSADGTEHVMGLVFSEGFVADWPFCIYGQKAKLAIVAVSDCEIYCIPTKDINEKIDADSNFKDIVMHATEAVYTLSMTDMLTCMSRHHSNDMMTLSINIPTFLTFFHSRTLPHSSISPRHT